MLYKNARDLIGFVRISLSFQKYFRGHISRFRGMERRKKKGLWSSREVVRDHTLKELNWRQELYGLDQTAIPILN